MTQRRCCCELTPPPGVPCQPCPIVPEPLYPSWTVYVEATGIIGDKGGTGGFATGPFYAYTCEQGYCGRVKHSRKAVGWPDPAQLPDCEETDVCDALQDLDAPLSAGSSELTWRGPVGGGTNPIQNCCGTFVPDGIPLPCIIAHSSDPWCQIEWVRSCIKWNGCTNPIWQEASPTDNDTRTLIKVNYFYVDTFAYPAFTADPGCPQITGSWTLRYYWECIYARRNRVNERFAEGTYALVWCHHWSQGGKTYDFAPGLSAILCPELDETHCSADGLTPVVPSSTWKPPENIVLMRLS